MGHEVTGTAVAYTDEIHIHTAERYEIRCITDEVQRIIDESGVSDGLVLVNPMHITASVYVNDLEYGLHADIMDWLEKVAPAYGVDGKTGQEYRHHRTGEDNGDAHLKRQLLGHQVTMPISNGRLHLGSWEQIHYAEFDGMRPKRVLVKIVGVRA
jgi:secondary thiamine-phosphate synthase enzyme